MRNGLQGNRLTRLPTPAELSNSTSPALICKDERRKAAAPFPTLPLLRDHASQFIVEIQSAPRSGFRFSRIECYDSLGTVNLAPGQERNF